jgi:hypothetical protein
MFSKIKNVVTKNISNIPGWKTDRKIVAFFVDDWGAIRIRDKKAYLALKKAHVDLDSNRFNSRDTLASKDDFSALYDVLSSVKDKNNKSAVFTALSAVANPDFEKIATGNFQEYFYEPFSETLKRYFPSSNVMELWFQGIKEGLFHPQFHGREHLNVHFWMKALQAGDKNVCKSFELQSIGPEPVIKSNYKSNYMAAYDFESEDELKELVQISSEGIDLFKEIFKYQPTLFTAPSLIHNSAIEPALKEKGIELVDRAKITFEPLGNANYRKKYIYLGQKNKERQTYVTRNCVFEPTYRSDSVESTLQDITTAFRWGKPAIISSHRVNFVGGIEEANRKQGLSSLREVLKQIVKRWPDAEFMTSSDLCNLMVKG